MTAQQYYYNKVGNFNNAHCCENVTFVHFPT